MTRTHLFRWATPKYIIIEYYASILNYILYLLIEPNKWSSVRYGTTPKGWVIKVESVLYYTTISIMESFIGYTKLTLSSKPGSNASKSDQWIARAILYLFYIRV
jgi:hypothetical protein